MRDYLKPLDGYRALAVIAVMLVHWGYLGAGWIGVQAFFVLSGYLISANLLRDRARIGSLSHYLKYFYWKRFLRLFPIYYAYIAGFLLIGLATGREVGRLLVPLLLYLVNVYAVWPGHADLASVGHFWSLAVEEQFYLLWPLLVFFARERQLKVLLAALVLVVPVVRLASYLSALQSGDPHYAGEVASFLPFNQMDAFASGAAVALLPAEGGRLPQRLFWGLLLMTLAAGGMNLLSLYGSSPQLSGLRGLSTAGYPHLMTANYQFVWGYTLLNLTCAALVWCVVRGDTPLPFLGGEGLAYLGRISYGVYVFHVPVLVVFRKLGLAGSREFPARGIFFCIIYFLATFLVAHLSYQHFEKIFLRLKERYRPGGAPALAGAAEGQGV